MRFLFLTFFTIAVLAQTATAASFFHIRAFAPHDSEEPSVIVKPLDDPDNPYLGQYSEYDLWCVEHYNMYVLPKHDIFWQLGLAKAQGFHPSLFRQDEVGVDSSKGLTLVQTVVDADGFIVPHYSTYQPLSSVAVEPPTLRDQLKLWRIDKERSETIFYSLGILPNELKSELLKRKALHSASQYPPIPLWMVSQNKDTVLLPDGGAVFIMDPPLSTAGQTGSLYAARYSAEGTLLKAESIPTYH